MISVLIADDHPIVRKGLKTILKDVPDIKVEDEASDGLEVMEKIRKADFDVLVLDLSMPKLDGLETIRRIKSEKPDMAILVLSMNPEEVFGIRALNLGASGYLSKDIALEQLIQAIRRVASGKVYISQLLAESIAQNVSRGSPKLPHEHLSDREYQIMLMIAQGKSLKAIGVELSVSVKTVSTHRTHILQKMGMDNNAQIVTYALQNSLLK
ncbi:MAG: response regulator transcription factor [Bacteroidetes bacterium]|jgi:two-component system invasion response regulator UvrY|nr:response regulator transcription factor [Bacteroidota bacterium]